MNLFINDVPVRLLKPAQTYQEERFNFVINAKYEPISHRKLIHHVLVTNVSGEQMLTILDLLNAETSRNLLSLTIASEEYKALKGVIKSKYRIIKAAGGLVRKGNKVLMIYRLKKWDLPKGKLDNGEKPKQAALREVLEETGIKVKVVEKICNTWHTYTMNHKNILKKTSWFLMDVTEDGEMRPQFEEEIEEVRWMSARDVFHALKDSYQSINFVFEEYYKLQEEEVKDS